MQARHKIEFTYLSQEHLLQAGCLDFCMVVETAAEALIAHRNDKVIFPDKTVQIFNEQTQQRINCLPATLRSDGVCGVKWVSVFPPNVDHYDLQTLTAAFVLSEKES